MSDQLNIAGLPEVARWTAAYASPSDKGGFVSYGGYIAAQAPLVERIKELEKQNAELLTRLQQNMGLSAESLNAYIASSQGEQK